MKKKILLSLLIGTSCLTLFGCNNSIKLGSKSQYATTDDLVSMNIKEDTLINTKVILLLNNQTDSTYMYGNSYLIEYELDGDWYLIKPIIKEMDFTNIGFVLKANKTVEISIDWEKTYGKLPNGKYRIVKNMLLLNNEQEVSEDKIFVSAEFIIK